MKKILVYTGTFRITTKAHIYIAKELKRLSNADLLYVIPANDSYSHKKYKASAIDRLNMLKIAFKDCENIVVSDCELKREGKAYTYDTLKYIKSLHPNDEIHYILGDDNLLFLQVWYKINNLLSEFKIDVCCRLKNKIENESIVKENLFLLEHKDNISIWNLPKTDINSISATEFITLYQNKEYDKLLNFTTPEVLNYIKSHDLYKK